MFLKKYLSRDFFFKNFYLKFGKETYYKENKKLFYGSFKFWRILFLNIINPGRFLIRLKYGQIIKNKKKILLEFKNSLKTIKDEHFQSSDRSEQLSKLSKGIDALIEDGGVVINNYFTEKEIDEFVNSNREIISKLKSSENISNNAKYYFEILKLNKELKKFWYEPGLIKMLESFFGKKIYARNYPYIKYTQVPKNFNISTCANDWHADHPLMFNIFILLEDVEKDGTRMQIKKGSHNYLNTGNFLYSENSVKNLETIDFYGKKGSLHIHTGNTIHRAKLSNGKNRLNLYFEYTLGPNILLCPLNLSKSLDKNFDIENSENLNFEEREFLKGIFPKPLFKGYEINRDSLNSSRYKGI